MIFIDANIPMYLEGASHPNRFLARIQVESLIAAGEHLATDAEVLQEILHRYGAIQRLDAIPAVMATILGITDTVFPVAKADVLRAAEILQTPSGLSARDSLHVAVMERRGIRRILTFDAAFDRWPGIERVRSGGLN